MLQVDALPKLGRIGFVRQPRHRHLDEIGIAEELGAVGVGSPHRLDQPVDRIGAVLAELLEVVAFKDVGISITCTPPDEGGGMETIS